MRSHLRALTLFALVGSSAHADAEPLSEVALYHRCFSRITGLFPDYRADENLAAIRAGRTTAIEACLAIFDSAGLHATGTLELPSRADALSQAVLARFHNLHSSWFLNRRIQEFDDVSLGTASLFDPTEPAAYITRALLNPTVPVSSIVTATKHLRVIRAAGGQTLFELRPEDFVFADAPVLSIGPIEGLDVAGPMTRAYALGRGDEEQMDPDSPPNGNFDIGAHYGGGILGSTPYLLLNVNETLGFSADGGRKMPRKWAKAALQDILCRDLPVIRVEDAIPFVVADSAVPFRRQTKCTQCHASIDRMASTIRGYRYRVFFKEGEEDLLHGGYFPTFTAASRAEQSGWPATEDPGYSRRPPLGTLYYRDHTGELVDIPIRGPAELGQRLAEQDGPYICLAQRYYRYFTGVEAFIGDPANFPAAAGSPDVRHREKVIALGRDLRASGDLRALVEAILRSPDYRESDFGASR